MKAGLKNPDIRDWIVQEASRCPEDTELQRVAERLKGLKDRRRPLDLDQLLTKYLSGDNAPYNELRFSQNDEVLRCVDRRLSDRPSPRELGLILRLLRGFEGRRHVKVAEVVLDHWNMLSGHDYRTTTEVLCSYSVSPAQRKQITTLLDCDLGGIHDATARRALKQLLK